MTVEGVERKKRPRVMSQSLTVEKHKKANKHLEKSSKEQGC